MNITGIILAGGKSSRLGTDKAFLKIGRNSIIEEMIGKFKSIFPEIIIVANRIERFNSLEAKVFPDIFPAKGPLGGIYTGLVKSNNFYNFISCFAKIPMLYGLRLSCYYKQTTEYFRNFGNFLQFA